MTNNFWNNIARSTVRELGKAAGVRASNAGAVADLTEKYGDKPSAEFVLEFWPVLRDGWLFRTAPDRHAVVENMRERGMGSKSAKSNTRPGQMAYLKSLKRSDALGEVVLPVFLESGSEERPEPVFAEPPSDAEEQARRFFESLREGLWRLDESTIESFEQALHFAAFRDAAELELPAHDPTRSAAAMSASLGFTMALSEEAEASDAPLQNYQRRFLDRVKQRVSDNEQMQQFMMTVTANLITALKDPAATQRSVATFAAALVMAMVAFDEPESASGSILDIMTAQQRFRDAPNGSVESDTGKAERSASDAATDPQAFVDAMSDALSRIPNTSAPQSVDDGTHLWSVYMGSAVIHVLLVSASERPPLIRFMSPLVHGVELTADLAGTLNHLNSSNGIGKFFWRDDTAWMHHEWLADSFHEAAFMCSIRQFAAYADHLDTQLKRQYGGTTTGHDQRAVFNV